jgi:hypothetical protein
MLQSKRTELEAMKADELRQMCKDMGISYYKGKARLTKAEMIDKLLSEVEENEDGTDAIEDGDKNAEQPEPVPVKSQEEIEAEEAAKLARRTKYIEEAKVGTIIAFKLESGKVISAMIVKKSTKHRKFKVETKYGVEHIVLYDEVLWVRTNKRWPKYIYNLFKENVKSQEVDEDVRDEEAIG